MTGDHRLSVLQPLEARTWLAALSRIGRLANRPEATGFVVSLWHPSGIEAAVSIVVSPPLVASRARPRPNVLTNHNLSFGQDTGTSEAGAVLGTQDANLLAASRIEGTENSLESRLRAAVQTLILTLIECLDAESTPREARP